MNRIRCAVALATVLALPAVAQQTSITPGAAAQQERENLSQAQLTLRAAEQAGAQTYAKTLYDEAVYRAQFADQNWNAPKREMKEQARLRAYESLWAARAALAKARWIGTNEAIRSLQADINRFGGHSDVAMTEESPDIALNRGTTSRDRIAYAQGIVDAARAAGAQQSSAPDVRDAQARLDSARKITKSQANSEAADSLAYIAEMMARRALYSVRSNESDRNLTPLQLERTRLAQAASERQAAVERARREEAQRQTAALQQQLTQEQANRQAQAAELDRLRQQVDENRRAIQQRFEQDRAARVEAERQFDEAMTRYQTAIGTGSLTDVETLRRQVEDSQLALRTVQDREKLNEQSMSSEIDRLRSELQIQQQQGSMDAQVLSQRQADIIQRQQELENLRKEREADVARRAQVEQQQQQAVAQAQQQRQEAEARAQALQQQVAEARQQAETTQAELDRTRQELAGRDAEARWLRMQQALAQVAPTRTGPRGLIVTLPGIFFDTGKTSLKPGAKNTLSRIAAQLKGDPAVRIAVEGHTDSVGSEEKNLALSEQRAQAVRDYLTGAGINGDSITATGKGETEPVASNKTVSGRQKNRRVELVITN